MKVVLSLSLILLSLLIVNADYIISVNPQWGACSGAEIPNSCSFNPDTSTNPVTSIVSWGTLGPGQNLTSRIRLQGPKTQTVIGGGYFLLSTVTHDNFKVTNGSLIPTQVGVSWTINLQDNSNAFSGTYTFSGVMNVNETLNQPYSGSGAYCPYGANWLNYGTSYSTIYPCCPFPTDPSRPCSDSLTAILDTSSTTKQIDVGTLSYKMIVAGFCERPTTDGCSFSTSFSFISQEEASNVRYLFGQLVVECNPASDTCQQKAQLIDPCRTGYCSGQVCIFGSSDTLKGKSCNPVSPGTCQSNYVCSEVQGMGTCLGTQSPDGTACSAPLTPGPCTKLGCSSGACQLIPITPLNQQCMPYSGATNSTCSSFTCQTGTGSLPTCAAKNAADGASCPDPGALPSNYNQQCAVQGCRNGKCGWLPTNNGASCGTATQCASFTCNNGQCQQVNSGYGSNSGCNPTDGSSPSGSCQSTYCDGNGQCVSGGSNKEGQTCQAATDCASFTCRNGNCQTDYRTGRCNVGQTPPTCRQYMCSNGVCTSPAITGQPCTDSQVITNNCTEKRCSSDGYCLIVPRASTQGINNKVVCQNQQNLGECQYTGCDGNGNCQVYYLGPYDYYNPCSTTKPTGCTKWQCTGSSATCQQVTDPSSVNCNDPTDGSTIGYSASSGYCTYGRCNAGVCTKQTVTNGYGCSQPPVSNLQACYSLQCSNGQCAATPNAGAVGACASRVCTIPYCDSNSYSCKYDRFTSNGTLCNGGATYDRQCAAERCDGTGNCAVVNSADYTACSGSTTPGQCQSYHCLSGKCTLGYDLSQTCSNAALGTCYAYKCQSDGSCGATADDTATCSGGTGNLGQCQVWGCRGGSCVGVPGNQGRTCTPTTRNECYNYACYNGECTPSVNVGATCTTNPNKDPCVRQFCNATGFCDVAPISEGASCIASGTPANDCNVKICRSGQCTAIDQSGKFCNTNLDNKCAYSVCRGLDCTRISRSENLPCNNAQANISSGDAYCQRQICISGVCSNPGYFFNNQTCSMGSDPCTFYRCASGYCDLTQTFPSAAGTSCSSGGINAECSILLCDGAGQCRANAADDNPCTEPANTYKKRAVPGQCQAYTCSAGVCTPKIKNVDGIPCVGNFSSPCTEGRCTAGECKPSLIANCSKCTQFKNCKTCVGGSYAGGDSKRGDIVTACRLNPNLPGCSVGCSWCGGSCVETASVDEYNQYFPPGSALSLQCTAKCPVAIVAETSSDISKPLGLGLGLGGGGLALLALLAAALAALIIFLKRKANTLDASAAQTAFVNNKAAEVGAIYEAEKGAETNLTYAGSK